MAHRPTQPRRENAWIPMWKGFKHCFILSRDGKVTQPSWDYGTKKCAETRNPNLCHLPGLDAIEMATADLRMWTFLKFVRPFLSDFHSDAAHWFKKTIWNSG
jgi:hypothetical protein